VIVVQRIVTTWSKKTRGADGRETRARLPRVYPLPDAALVIRARCVQHVISRSAHDGYRVNEGVQEDTSLRTKPGISPTSIVLREHDGMLDVLFVPEGDAGIPRRAAAPIRLTPGSWGCARYNGRFQAFDDPWYEEKIVNIAYEMPLARALFTSDGPTATLDAEVDLW
jgi:hypothetical protein